MNNRRFDASQAHRIRATDALDELRSAGFLRTTHENAGQCSWLVQGEMP